MPTVFEHIAQAVNQASLDDAITGQISGLDDIGAGIGEISSSANTHIGVLSAQLRQAQVASPDLENIFGPVLSGLREHIPENPSSLLSGLQNHLSGLLTTAKDDIVQPLLPLVASYQCVQEVIDLLEKAPAMANSVSRASSRNPTAGSTSLPEALRSHNDLLDTILPLLTPERVSTFLADVENGKIRRMIPSAYLPVLDELSRIFATLKRWKGMTSAAIGTELTQTLQSISQFLDRRIEGLALPIATDLSTIAQLNAATFSAAINEYASSVEALSQAVSGGNNAQITSALAQATAARTAFEAQKTALNTHLIQNGAAERLALRLRNLPDELKSEMLFILNTLEPPPVEDALAEMLSRANARFLPEEVETFAQLMETIFDKFNDLAEMLHLEDVSKAVGEGSDAVKNVLKDLDNSMTELTGKVSFALEQALRPVTDFDSQAVTGPFEDTLNAVKNTIRQQIAQFFELFQNALNQALSALTTAVNDFKPADLKQALTEFTAQIGQALSSPDVLSKLESIKSAVSSAIDQLENVNFKPVADLVIEQINKISETLSKLTSSSANPATKMAISAAVAVLPGDSVVLDFKGQLLVKMDGFVMQGPIALLRAGVELPPKLLDEIKKNSPLSIVGEKLSKPYNLAIKQMEETKPSQLLQPVQKELETLRGQLADSLNLARLMAPLEQLFDDLLRQLERLNPEQLAAPVKQAISGIIMDILDAVPISKLTEAINKVASQMQEMADLPPAVLEFMEKVATLLREIALFPSRLDAWFADIFSKIEAIPASTNLSSGLTQINQARERLKANELKIKLLQPAIAAANTITGIDPVSQTTRLLQWHRDFPRTAAEALQAPQKQQVLDFLSQNNPLLNGTSALLNQLRQIAEQIKNACDTAETSLAHWDELYLAANSPLLRTFPAGFSLANAKQMLRETIESEIRRPIANLVQETGHFSAYVAALQSKYEAFLTRLSTLLPGLLNAPAALVDLSKAIDEVVNRIRNFNIDFIVSSLGTTYTHLRNEIGELHPARFRQTLQQTINESLDALRVESLLPPNALAQLDARMTALTAKLKELDPAVIVSEVLQPEFERLLNPYLEIFDFNDLLDQLLARLDALKLDLDAELNRVADAYREMRASVPAGALSGGVDLGF